MAIQKSVIDRCNLTALLEPGQEDTAEFLAVNNVHIIGDEFLDKTENRGHSYIFSASLPCYSAKNVNLQRGSGVFQRSMEALRILNDLGYGKSGSGLILDLVYNPLGLIYQFIILEKKKQSRVVFVHFQVLFCPLINRNWKLNTRQN